MSYIRFDEVRYSVKVEKAYRPILNGISGFAKSRTLTTIVGHSGAGKTSLLNILANRCPHGKARLSGNLVNDGREVWDSKERVLDYRRRLGYVLQTTPMAEQATVYETFEFAAMLKLPKAMTRKDKIERVEETINLLKLETCRNTKIGGCGRRGISGGERKRVSIGLEILHRPEILMCDEPTSGLDATQAQSVMSLLKEIAVKNNSILIVSIHQPRSSIYQMTDRVIVLERGDLVYQGPQKDFLPFFASLDIVCPQYFNPFDFALDEVTKNPKIIKSAFQHFSTEVYSSEFDTETSIETSPYSSSFTTQFRTLLKRSLRNLVRDSFAIKVKFGTQLFISFVIIIIYSSMGRDNEDCDRGDLAACSGQFEDEIGVLFFITVQNMFSCIFNTVNVFVPEMQVMLRERTSRFYSLESFYCARVVALIPLEILNQVISSSIIYWSLDFKEKSFSLYVYFFLLASSLALAGAGLGLCFSALGRGRLEVSSALIPPFAILLMILGGFYIKTSSLPRFFEFFTDINFIRLAFSSFIANQFRSLESTEKNELERVLNSRGVFWDTNKWVNYGWLIFIAVCHFTAAYILLSLLNRPRFLTPALVRVSTTSMT